MAANTAVQIGTKRSAEVRNAVVSFRGLLDLANNETLTGSPTVSVSPSGPTIDNEALNTESIGVDDETARVSEAVKFRISGGTDGTDYTLTIQCGTNSSPAQTLEVVASLRVRD